MNSMTATLPGIPPANTRLRHHRHTPPRPAEHVNVRGRPIRVDVFEPDSGAHARAILLLHGVGGLLGDGGLMRRAARRLAHEGFHAGVVHYFDATGTFFATHATVREHAAEWRDATVEIAKSYALSGGSPVGLLGYSLGGLLAIDAAESSAAIGAVAVVAGGFESDRAALCSAHLPPMLILHGGADKRVPVERADALAQMGRRAGALVESVVYPMEGHHLGVSAERDALDRAAAFFAARLDAGAGR